MQQQERMEERMVPALAGAVIASLPPAPAPASPAESGRGRAAKILENVVRAQAGQNLAEVAHDARNLVTALGLYCDLLEEPGVLTPGFRHYASELRLVATACRRLVEQLGALDAGSRSRHRPSQSEAGLTPAAGRWERARVWEALPPEPVANLAAELIANRNLLSALAGPGIVLAVEACGGAQPVRMNGEDLTRILVNLVKNAAEAMPTGGRIRLGLEESSTSAGAPSLLLTIEDSGPGLPPQALEKIFESGYSTRPVTSGVVHRGLGLSIARSIVWAAGGRISAANRSQGGARFQIELPVASR